MHNVYIFGVMKFWKEKTYHDAAMFTGAII